MKNLKRGSFAKWGAEGGSAKTKAKTQAARRNGKKGGRPPKLREFTVFVPCGYSEIYTVRAKSAKDAVLKLRNNGPGCHEDIGEYQGETVTGREHEGFRAVEVKKSKGTHET